MASIPVRTRGEVVTKLWELVDLAVSADGLVEATYPYLPTNPSGLSPIVAVAPLATDRMGSTAKRRAYDTLLSVYIMCLYSSTAGGIDEQAAWDALNAIEHVVAEVIAAAYRVDDYWTSITYNEPSAISVAVFDNHGYLFEAIPLRIQTI